jgi:hypothetical protein
MTNRKAMPGGGGGGGDSRNGKENTNRDKKNIFKIFDVYEFLTVTVTLYNR